MSARALSDAELLSLVLQRDDVAALLGVGGLKALAQSDPDVWVEDPRLDVESAVRLLAAFELGRRAVEKPAPRDVLRTPASIADFMRPLLANLRREEMHVLCMSTSNHLLRHARVAVGTATWCSVDPREVFAPAITCRAAGIVLVHNHPSGDSQPSTHDVALTRQLVRAGEALSIRVLDHLVLAEGGTFTSMLTVGLMSARPAME